MADDDDQFADADDDEVLFQEDINACLFVIAMFHGILLMRIASIFTFFQGCTCRLIQFIQTVEVGVPTFMTAKAPEPTIIPSSAILPSHVCTTKNVLDMLKDRKPSFPF